MSVRSLMSVVLLSTATACASFSGAGAGDAERGGATLFETSPSPGDCEAVGDPCVREDGRSGTCKEDDSDPGQFECDDDGVGTGSDDTATDDNGGGGGDADRDACVGLAEGDPCVRHNGDAGTCQPDDSDPDVLKCED